MGEDDNVAATLPHNNNISRDATLSNCPRDLYILWDEYKHGLQGRTAANDFINMKEVRLPALTAKEIMFGSS